MILHLGNAYRRGSAWLMTRAILGKRRRSPRSTVSTRSWTALTDSAASTRQWKLTISPSAVSRTRTSCTSPRPAIPAASEASASLISLTRARDGVAAGEDHGRQRLDMRFHLDVGPELLADRLLEPAGDVVRGEERQRSIDLEIGRNR